MQSDKWYKNADDMAKAFSSINPFYPQRQVRHMLHEHLRLTSDEDIKELLYISQTYLGKTLSSTETNTILYFYDGLKFPIDLIEYLIEYCVSNGHTAMKYIETVALSWAKENITSVDMAKARMASVKGNSYPIMKAFGLSGRNLATSEQEFVIKWPD